MGLFNRGQSISGMWLDGKPAIRAYLGDVLVWDGTKPAFVNVPRALASALAVAPVIRADASITAVRTLGSSAAYAPSLTAFATVDPETAVIVTAQASAPVVRADSIIMVQTITVGAQALPAVAAQSSAATVATPAAVVSVATPTPSVAAHFATTVPAIAVNATAQVPVITATGAAVVNVPVSAVNAMARVPAVSGSSSVGAFAVTADSTAKIPTMTASSTVSTPAATATGLAKNPSIQTGPTILVTDNFNRTAGELTTPWTRFVSWFQDSYQITATGTVKRNSGGTASADSFDGYIHGTALPGQNQYASLWVTTFGSSNGNPGPGLILRTGSTSAPALMGQVYYNTWRIITIAQVGAGGTPVVLKSGTGSFTAGGKIEMSVRNEAGVDTVSLSYKGVVLDTYSGTGLPTGLYHGFSTGEATNQVDDYAAGTP